MPWLYVTQYTLALCMTFGLKHMLALLIILKRGVGCVVTTTLAFSLVSMVILKERPWANGTTDVLGHRAIAAAAITLRERSSCRLNEASANRIRRHSDMKDHTPPWRTDAGRSSKAAPWTRNHDTARKADPRRGRDWYRDSPSRRGAYENQRHRSSAHHRSVSPPWQAQRAKSESISECDSDKEHSGHDSDASTISTFGLRATFHEFSSDEEMSDVSSQADDEASKRDR